ncbi:T9SS type A sorting domain-containing protein [Patiriisocius hiemis]|uniref:T9SS type A sorting domain-containing protein n=1 Tax=Patiriisocius hiemis TaxID=3075604 RepID=A0ABU2Y925_9FLAO|nr:T9SS type A sorting domain-containing protein [Constantimarinum sp. W242]MDT0554675.1 T9SS type A sorting domain-containing protein [Constantimarinum sp. W242]
MKNILFTIILLNSFSMLGQVMAGQPDPIILCDVNNPGDEMEVFDMTIREAQIINGQNNVSISYHPTSGDALGNGAVITNPESFVNEVNPQQIFIRLQSTTSSDFDITILELRVPVEPEVQQQPDDIEVEDDNNDGFATFNLTENESQAVGTQDPFLLVFNYYITLQDAESKTNPIINPEFFVNTIPNQQTIFARIEPIEEECEFLVYDFEIRTQEVLDISESVFSRSVFVYPNPSSEILFIKTKSILQIDKLVVYDTSGKLVEELASTSQLDVSNYANGVYFLKVISKAKTTTLSFIKK